MHLNIRSYTHNFDEFSCLFKDIKEKIDIYVFSETWFHSQNCIPMPNFSGFHTTRSNKKGGGVSVYVKNSHKARKISKLSGVRRTFELCTVSVTIANPICPYIYVIGIYRPPSTCSGLNVSTFFDEFCSFISDNFKSDDKILLLGDFNIDIASSSDIGRDLIEIFVCRNFKPLITEPTKSGNKIIHHIWSNCSYSFNSGVIPTGITDHYVIFSTFKLPNNSQYITKLFRDHSNISIRNFQSSIDVILNDEICRTNIELDQRVSDFTNKLYDKYNENCPIRRKTYTENSVRKPWLTKDLLKLVRFKHYLFRQYNLDNLPFYIYNSFKNKLCTILKASKNRFLKYKFHKCVGNSRETWQNINSLFRNNYSRSTHISLEENGSCLKTDLETANIFNNYFSTVAVNLDSNIPRSNISPISFLGNPFPHSFFMRPSNKFEIKHIILNFKNKGCPINEIPTYIFKQVVDPLSIVLSLFFNCSISNGSFPSVFKISRIVPIFKTGDNTSKFNYRPISVLSFFSKVFEKLVYFRLNAFLDSHNVICRHQFGFRKGLSTSDAIVEYLDCAYNAINNSSIFMTIFLDFSKAFDSVNHEILLQKLYHYGIRGLSFDWFRSYLSNRLQCVSINECKSDYVINNIGVPQGSILGPLLFILYTNDMYTSCNKLQLIHYADDTTAFISGNCIDELSNVVNSQLESMYVWLQSNRLTLNISKSSYMIHGYYSFSPSTSITIQNQLLNKTINAKFLGITIDEKLKFEIHINNVISKINKVTGILWKTKEIVHKTTLRMLYLSLAWSHLTYGVLAWGRGNLVSLNKLQNAQNKLVKIIYGSHNNSIYQLNNLLRVTDTYDFFALIKLFSELNVSSSQETYFAERIQNIQTIHDHFTRFGRNLNIIPPQIRKSKCYASFLYKSINLWNNLPLNIKNSISLSVFKNKVRAFLLDNMAV